MDVKNVNKIRIESLLSRHGFLSAKSISNRVKLSLDDVSSALIEMLNDGAVMADDTGREWGGDPVITFRLSKSPKRSEASHWKALASVVQSKGGS
jgi:predicted ArsR family transcriptional regulator